ncbi:MAG TPA: beta-propeller domain-containing protein, partial [Candidatus Angelobacter sp.]|nr:beta-propeller domain-containing protein [Candidatus Angelobacter sp.]
MKRFLIVAISAVVIILGIVGWVVGSSSHFPLPVTSALTPPKLPAPDSTQTPNTAPRKTMRAFHSARELKAYFRKLAKKQMHRSIAAPSVMSAAPAPPPALSVDGAAQPTISTEVAAVQESVTNVQHAGVDEGAIVKLHGDHLVVLRRGRLFTIAINDGALTPISGIDAFGPEIDPAATWYDEMLVSEDRVIVIGYSYAGGGTEVGLFQIDPAGKLTYRATYHLRSDDYYSSRNYASRLIGSRLILYTPLPIMDLDNPFQSLPAVRRWHKGAAESEFHRIVSANRIYRPEHAIDSEGDTFLHTVTICDLSGGKFACKATSVIGPSGEVFYVSPKSVYVWVTEEMPEGEQTRAKSMVYRMPLDGSAPSALRVSGSPVDQFSFLESEDGHLNVLVRSEATGNGMWNAEEAAGDVALMRVPLNSFSDGTAAAPFSSYRKLPTPVGEAFQNRFVGDYVLYGTGSGWGYPQKVDHPSLYAVRWAGGAPHELALTHGTDRIEQMGSDAVVVGVNGNNLHFTAIRLGDWP